MGNKFSEGKVHGVQPDLFSRGPWGADGAWLSIVTLRRKETVSVEVNRNRKSDWEKSKPMSPIYTKFK